MINRVSTNIIAVTFAIIIGLLIDKAGDEYFGEKNKLRVILQFLANIGVILILEYYVKNITDSILFVSVFLGVQQNLFKNISNLAK